jgi:hypothetical protein
MTSEPRPPRAPVANDEWELAEMIEHLSAQLDEVTDTLALRAKRRDTTHRPASVSLELYVSSRYDAENRRVLFRSSQPGEEGLSKLHLELAPAVSEQFEAQMPDVERPRDHRLIDLAMLLFLGVHDITVLSKLVRLGIRSIADLADMARTEIERQVIAAKTGLPVKAIAALLRPFVERVTTQESDWWISGHHFGNTPGAVLADDGKPLPLVSWSDTAICVHAPPRGVKLISVVTSENAKSDPHSP